MTGRADVRVALFVAAAFLTAWSFATPIFEGPDEFVHWQYARHLHDTWRLPVYGPTFGEGNSPPLYYAAIAPVAAQTVTPPPAVWIDGVGLFAMPFLPRFFLGAADDLQHYWPIRYARLLTVLMSLITVAICVRIGMDATTRVSVGLLTAAFLAFLPQFTFRGSHISNDALVTTCAAATLWAMVSIVRHGFTWRRGVLAAIALAAAFLTKINAACLAPALAVVILTEPVPWRARLTHLLGVFGVAAMLVAPWSIRNVVLYGDLLAIDAMRAAVAPLVVDRRFTDPYFIHELPRELFKTFVGSFGHMTVRLPRLAYLAYLALFVFAAVAACWRARRDRITRRLLLVLATIVVSAIAIVIRINLQFNQPQGRYLFPALPAIALWMAIGLDTARRPWATRAIVAVLALANAFILTRVLMPAYERPPVERISKALTVVDMPQPTADNARASTNVPTDDALFVIFDLEGRIENRVEGGTDGSAAAAALTRDYDGIVVLTRSDRADEIRVPFRWRADGTRRTIYLTLLNRPDWSRSSAMVTSLGVLPIASPTSSEPPRSVAITLDRVRLAGSIPSHDF